MSIYMLSFFSVALAYFAYVFKRKGDGEDEFMAMPEDDEKPIKSMGSEDN